MIRILSHSKLLTAITAAALFPTLSFAQAIQSPELTVNKGDGTWMLVSTIIVLLMTVPGLALFYGTVIAIFLGLRVSPAKEREGLDIAEHGERAYNA